MSQRYCRAMPVPDTETTLGVRIRELRRSAGWTQADLAGLVNKHAGLSLSWRQTTVSEAETAHRPIRVNDAAALAVVFGIPLADLIDNSIDPSTALRLRQRRAQERELRLKVERATRERIAAEILAKIR
jgi:transcriptional regulator with XRE-family HTH domain